MCNFVALSSSWVKFSNTEIWWTTRSTVSLLHHHSRGWFSDVWSFTHILWKNWWWGNLSCNANFALLYMYIFYIDWFLAQDVIYTSRTSYAMMSVSICLSVTEMHWYIIANLGFDPDLPRIVVAGRGHLSNNISCYASHC